MPTLLRIDTETLPRVLILDPPVTDGEFEALCRENDNVQFERTKEGAIRMNRPPEVGLAAEIRRLPDSSITVGRHTNAAESSIRVGDFVCLTDQS